MADSIDESALPGIYRAMGLRVPLEGIQNDDQKCQNLSCEGRASRTLFLQHKTAAFPVRVWFCERCANIVMGPKPIGARVLFQDQSLESIPMELRDQAKAQLTAQLQGFMLEQLVRPKPNAEVQWHWEPVSFTDVDGHIVKGTELLGTIEVERIELDAPTQHP